MLEEIQSNEKYASQNVDTYQDTYHSTNLHQRVCIIYGRSIGTKWRR